MKHYYHPMSRAMTSDWMLRELDADHEQVLVEFMAGESATPEFRAINPMGKIPVLVDGDVVVTEVAAICAYLADKFPEQGMAPEPGSPERGRYYRYMFLPGATLEPMFTFSQYGVTDYPAQSAGWGDRERCLQTIEALTPSSGWVFEEQFTAADVVFGGMLDLAVQFGWLDAPSEKVTAYVQRLKSRPAYRDAHDPSWH